MTYPSLTARFLEAIDQRPNPRALLYKAGDRWESITSQELLRRVAGLSAALAELGVKAGDRVGLLAPNCPEWHVADFAILGLGAADVPLYFRESDERIRYILNDSGAHVVVVAGAEQVRRFLELRAQLPGVERVIVARAPESAGGDALRLENLIAVAGEKEIRLYRERAAAVRPESLATIIYTSGTTGEPKGVMLSHANISSNDIEASTESVFLPDDVGLSFLPLNHVYERMIDYGYISHGITVAYVERPEDVQFALREVQPTIMASVPRVFEKIYETIQEKGSAATGFRRTLFEFAMRTARDAAPWRAHGRPVSLGTQLRWRLADKLLYPKIRAGLGGRLRSCTSGSAPLALDMLEFFWTVGVQIYQGYGLTETSPVVSTNTPLNNKIGTVGKTIPNVEVRIADDGEILVRGPCIMLGYYNKPEATRAALSPDRWLRTGDIGYLDADGYLVITDRKKDLIKTAAGKYVAPQPIENRLKASRYIQNAVVIGDRHKYVVALIVPQFATLEGELRTAGLELASRAELVAHPLVREIIGKEVEGVNAHLAQFETVKRHAILDHDFSFEGGELTYTMKLKRRTVEQRYAAIIESLYAEDPEPRPLPHPAVTSDQL
jgi:long-chain acyl-CoA synthetase